MPDKPSMFPKRKAELWEQSLAESGLASANRPGKPAVKKAKTEEKAAPSVYCFMKIVCVDHFFHYRLPSPPHMPAW